MRASGAMTAAGAGLGVFPLASLEGAEARDFGKVLAAALPQHLLPTLPAHRREAVLAVLLQYCLTSRFIDAFVEVTWPASSS